MADITTPGALLIRSKLPTEKARKNFDIHRPLDKAGMTALINNLVQHGGEKAYDTINSLAQMFFDRATQIGATTPLSDYENDSHERQVLFSEFEHNLRKILESKIPQKEKLQKLDALAGTTRKHLNQQNLRYLVERGSMAAKMAKSGARGNPDQLGIGTASPLMAFDVKGHPIPVAIKHSFAEGLSPAEFFAMSYGGRASTVLTQLSTEKPGALFKKLTPSVFHDVITKADCGTKNGILVPADNAKALVGRFEAGTNHLIDEHYYSHLKGRQTVKVRSPMTCEAHEGMCQKCYGVAANGHLPEIGENVGVIAAQSISEVLTQAMLSTKHQGGVSGGQRNVFEEANNLLSNPRENFQDESSIARVNGVVTNIHQTALKDYEVTVGNEVHFVSREQEPIVHIGDHVRVGDPLSTGTINPRKLVELKGAGAGRIYLANKLAEVYGKKSAGLDPRHFEIVSKNMIRFADVKDPGHSGFLPGDRITVSDVARHFNEHKTEVPLKNAHGKTLAQGVLDLTPGTHLTDNHISDLAKAGIQTVHVGTSGLKVDPVVPGLYTVKLADDNWVSNLSFSQLINTIKGAAATGAKSKVHSTDPIAPYIMGTEFGEGEHGKY